MRVVNLKEVPVQHQGDSVGEHHGLLLIVGHEDRRDADFALHPTHQVAHLDSQVRIELAERLVEQEDVGIGHDGQVKAKFVIMFTFRDGDDALAVESKIPAASNSLDPKILQFRVPEIAPKEFGNVLES